MNHEVLINCQRASRAKTVGLRGGQRNATRSTYLCAQDCGIASGQTVQVTTKKCMAWSCFSLKSGVFGQRMPHFAVILWEAELTNVGALKLWVSVGSLLWNLSINTPCVRSSMKVNEWSRNIEYQLRYKWPVGETPHMKLEGMFVVSLRGVNFGFWSHLGCSGQNAIIFSREVREDKGDREGIPHTHPIP